MPIITEKTPAGWEELEELVRDILLECGMRAGRQVKMRLPRGTVDVDVLAEETIDGISQLIVCECKNWKASVSKSVVHSFRTVMQETGANRGYIISREGFQAGAVEAAHATNIELITFQQFQTRHFDKWYRNRLWSVEEAAKNFNVYYEPLGRPGYSLLTSDEECAAYDTVWDKFLPVGMMLTFFSPYLTYRGRLQPPKLPIDISAMLDDDVPIPEKLKGATDCRELLTALEDLAVKGLSELRRVNPVTRGKDPATVARDN
jgi:hypothetical protein